LGLRVDVGTGYRIYYELLGTEVMVLLGGGGNYLQSAQIDRAVTYWKSAQKELA
jgi:putative addiction module killer protein